MKRRKFKNENGFEDHGGYMRMKISKLEEQFQEDAVKNIYKKSDLFSGISIFVNGYTKPSADELKRIMMAHGGVYHTYQRSTTNYTIASNLPDVKIRQLTTEKVVRPEWIVDSLNANKVLDYTQYLLYTNCKQSQPKIMFGKKMKDPMIPVLKHNKYEISKDDFKNILKKISILNEKIQSSTKNSLDAASVTPIEDKIDADEASNSSNVDILTQTDEDFKELENKNDESLHQDEFNTTFPPKYSSYEEDMIPASSPEMEYIPASPPELTKTRINRSIVRKTDNNTVHLESELSKSRIDRSIVKGTDSNTANSESKISLNQSKARTAVDPNFLSDFFSNSRLHHIATLGAGFKQYINELRSGHNGLFPDRENLNYLRSDDTLYESSERFVMHIDMDCFFVSVGLRKYPHLRGLPVAVTHSKDGKTSASRAGVDRVAEINMYKKRMEEKFNPEGDNNLETECKLYNIDENNSMSEIASCSYEARKLGVKNGMFVGSALKLCPNLKTMPYDFEGYKEVAYTLYNTIAKYTLDIEAVSCDEMFVDLTSLLKATNVNCLDFISHVRKEIRELTRCPCSAGIGANKLQARLATKKAKPNGQFHLLPQDVEDYMKEIEISELPGVGRSTNYRLAKMNWKLCGDLQRVSLIMLQKDFGKKFGEKLYSFCRGEDDTEMVFDKIRKSVSAEVNYGIRFKEDGEVETFMKQLCCEVHNRLKEVNKRGKCITLKLMTRAKDAPLETAKFMGHGLCDYVNKSTSLNSFTCDLSIITKSVLSLLKMLAIKPEELRGIGIQISKLEDSSEKEKPNVLMNMFKSVNTRKVEDTTLPTTNDVETPPIMKVESTNDTIFDVSDQSPVKQNKTITSTAKKGKGRPRKNETSSNNVAKMFNNIIARKKYEMDIDCEFDPEVLAALPDDIREEAIRDYRKQHIKKKIEKELVETETTDKIHVDSKFLDILPTQLREDLQKQITLQADKIVLIRDNSIKEFVSPTKLDTKSYKRSTLLFAEDNIYSLKEWIALVSTWIDSCDKPDEYDIKMVSKGACKFISAKKMQDIIVGLNYLHKIITDKKAICEWHSGYRKIIDIVQIQMMNAYNRKLEINNDFNNCRCSKSYKGLKPLISDDNIFDRKEWRTLISSWVDSCEKPEDYDVNMLAQGASEFICAKRMHDIYIPLKFMHRIISERKDNCDWHSAYRKIINAVQIHMLRIYNSKLDVNPNINNCKCK